MTWDEAHDFAATSGAHLALLATTEQLEWFHENFKTPTPTWLGASDSGLEKKWMWANGTEVDPNLWAPGTPDEKTEQSPNGEDFAAISENKPVLDDHYRLEKFPCLLEWNLDGTTPASIDSQLARIGQALDKKTAPIFPAGTYNIGGSRFLLVNREISWEDAQTWPPTLEDTLPSPPMKAKRPLWPSSSMIAHAETAAGSEENRSEETAEIWQYVTGEVFTFINWLEGQPDNDNEYENHLVLKKPLNASMTKRS